MKRIVLILVFGLFTQLAVSQDVIMSKETHELLRKDIENYKKLIIAHKKVVNENKTLKDSIQYFKNENLQLRSILNDCTNQIEKQIPAKKNFFKRLNDKIRNLSKPKKKNKPYKHTQIW